MTRRPARGYKRGLCCRPGSFAPSAGPGSWAGRATPAGPATATGSPRMFPRAGWQQFRASTCPHSGTCPDEAVARAESLCWPDCAESRPRTKVGDCQETGTYLPMMVRPMVAKNAAMPTRQLARKPEAATDHHVPRLPSCATASLRATPLQLVGGRGQVDDQRSHDEGACQAPTQASTQNLTTRTAGPRRTHQHSASTSMISRWRSTGAPPPTMRYWNRLSSSSEVTILLLERAPPANSQDRCVPDADEVSTAGNQLELAPASRTTATAHTSFAGLAFVALGAQRRHQVLFHRARPLAVVDPVTRVSVRMIRRDAFGLPRRRRRGTTTGGGRW